MTEEPEASEQVKVQKKSLSMKQLLIFGGIILVLVGGGFFAYTKMFAKHDTKKEGAKETEHKEEDKHGGEQVLIPMDPLIVNLTDKNRFIKVSLQIEVGDKKIEEKMKEKMPLLRDAVIMLLTSKSFDAISGPDGKFQLKDEILGRMNQALGREIIKNVYFTDFMVQ